MYVHFVKLFLTFPICTQNQITSLFFVAHVSHCIQIQGFFIPGSSSVRGLPLSWKKLSNLPLALIRANVGNDGRTMSTMKSSPLKIIAVSVRVSANSCS